ncbi:MAG: hypothetical protein ABIN89_08690 [Chitinophagaceae bacterium]
MSTENYITASCVISDCIVYKNGSPVFENANADLPGFLLSAYQHFKLMYPRFYKMDNLSKLGMITSEVLLKPEFPARAYQPGDIGVVLANANSSLDTDIKYYETVRNIASPSLFVYTLPNIMIGEICIRNNFKGENAFFVFNRFDANFIGQYVSNLLHNNILKACICGWIELLEDKYSAFLCVVERKETGLNNLLFTIENINKIYPIENG